MATEIARTDSSSLASRLIDVTQNSHDVSSLMQGFTLNAISTGNEKLVEVMTRSVQKQEVLLSVNEHLHRITEILRFIRTDQLGAILTHLLKPPMKGINLNKAAQAADAHDDKAAKRKADEDENEKNRPKASGPEMDVPKEFAFKPGGLFYAIATAIGIAVGVISGQITAIKTFAKLLTPKWVSGKLSSAMKGIGESITKAFRSFKSMFTSLGDSKVGKILGKIKVAMKAFFKPFIVLGEMIGPAVKSFGGIAAKIAPLVAKIFAPIAIIMGVVDAVKGAMKGYDKGGIGGMVFGAIQGLMNGLVMKPLDLLKDLISWVAGRLGFENFAAALDSFSFENMFTDLTDKFIDMSAAFNNKLKEIVKGLLPDPDSFLAKFIPDAVYEWADSHVPPADAVQTKQDVAMQENAAALMEDTPSKSSVKVKKFPTKQEVLQKKYLGVTMSKPHKDAPAMEATKHNAQIKQDAENLKEQSKQIQVNAPQVMNDNSAQTINNLAAELPTKPAAWGRR
jgi:hypothetical protein